jgi:phosphoglycolate phosphatase
MKKLIIFDMDGTLVDSSLTIANAINSVREKLSLKPMDEAKILDKINDPHLNPAQYFYEAEKFIPEHEQWFSEYYTQNHERELRLYKGIADLLKLLKAKEYKIALATNAYRNSTLQSLEHLSLMDTFDAVVCFDDVKRGKPNPAMLLKILEDLNVSPQEALFVGDGERDMLASKAANIDYIMVNWGFSEYTENVIESVEKLKEIIFEKSLE